ncbi:MAG: hypothetical protein V3V97_09160 [Hyphomicrobiaceae bacterium]|jgi:hypothetical protein
MSQRYGRQYIRSQRHAKQGSDQTLLIFIDEEGSGGGHFVRADPSLGGLEAAQ